MLLSFEPLPFLCDSDEESSSEEEEVVAVEAGRLADADAGLFELSVFVF